MAHHRAPSLGAPSAIARCLSASKSASRPWTNGPRSGRWRCMPMLTWPWRASVCTSRALDCLLNAPRKLALGNLHVLAHDGAAEWLTIVPAGDQALDQRRPATGMNADNFEAIAGLAAYRVPYIKVGR